MKVIFKIIVIAIAIPTSLLLTLFGILIFLSSIETEEYGRNVSPDGEYYLVARKTKLSESIPMVPGASGDASGIVTLYSKNGEVLGKLSIDMVHQIHSFTWKKNEVSIPSGTAFKLPVQQNLHNE